MMERRKFMTAAAGAVSVAAVGLPMAKGADEPAPVARPGALTEETLGNLLGAIGLDPKKEKQRYDFAFKAIYNGEEWVLSMSGVLSTNNQSLWIMAWLDELPRSAADVPRTALLRLLSDNDRLGKGRFFSYIASNRRFVLQRVVANENLDVPAVKGLLKDLGEAVVYSYPHWSVTNWKSGSEPTQETTATDGKTVPDQPAAARRSTAAEQGSPKN